MTRIILLSFIISNIQITTSFLQPLQQYNLYTKTTTATKPTTFLLLDRKQSVDDVVLYSDNDDDDDNDEDDDNIDMDTKLKQNSRWNSLNSSVKLRLIKEGQQRAIANKKKREPAADKKRRMLMYYKKVEKENKRNSRIPRKLDLGSSERIPLNTLTVGEEHIGQVISLTNFGAYIDIGTECDGLLHVSQMTRKEFVEHPRQVLTPGDEVTVRIVRFSSELKKLQLSMLSTEEEDAVDYNNDMVDDDSDEEDERIPLSDLAVDDELWGEIRRVTSFGAYVELGAQVQGWLHFMDHPSFGNVPGAKPNEFMKQGDRIRCWVANVELDRKRIKLTANRPGSLPGPRREDKKL